MQRVFRRGMLLALMGGLLFCGVLASHLLVRDAAPAERNVAGPVDIGFAQFMAMHHDQAVLMSQIILSRAPSELGGIAMAIQTSQLIEIGQMQGMLLMWGRPVLPSTRSMDWMRLGKTPPDATLTQYLADCRSSPSGMPGTASTDELNQLRALSGAQRDHLFLQLMIRHHQAALPMAQFAASNAETPQVRALAGKIAFDQAMELERLAHLLSRYDGD